MAWSSMGSVRGRVWATRAVILMCIGTTLATSPLPTWGVAASGSDEIPFEPGGPSVFRTTASVMYETPRGRWPLELTIVAEPRVIFALDAGGILAQLQLQVEYAKDEHTRQLTGSKWEVMCRARHCSGSVEVDITATLTTDPSSGIYPVPTGVPQEAGLPFDPDAAFPRGALVPTTIRASFNGGVEGGGFYSCDRKDSSTDSENPPRALAVATTIEPYAPDRDSTRLTTTAPLPFHVDAGGLLLDASTLPAPSLTNPPDAGGTTDVPNEAAVTGGDL